MNLPCELIRDLLPLYAEQMTQEETNALIREHLDSCPDCAAALEALKKPEEAVSAESAAPLEKLKKSLRARRLRTAALAAAAVFLPLFTLFARSAVKQYLPYSQGLVTVEGPGEGREDGLFLSCDPVVSGLQMDLAEDPDTGERTLFIMGYRFAGRGLISGLSDQEERTYFHTGSLPNRVIYGFGGAQTLLYGEPMEGGTALLPRLVLGYYFWLSLGLAAVLGAAAMLLRRRKAGPILGWISLAPASWAAGQLLVKGFDTVSFDAQWEFLLILAEAAGVFALVSLLWQQIQQRKKDRV